MSKKILIVDDDRDIRLGLSVRLRALGYDTIFAEDGMQAVKQAREQAPHLILLDLGLPGGDGYTVLERLSAIAVTSAIPVIVISAHGAASHKDKALKLGACEFFQKPVDDDELMFAIKQQLGL